MFPSHQKTWQYNINNVLATPVITTQAATVLHFIKNAMVTFSLNPWTVAGSSDSSGNFGMDAVDRWTSAASLRWATSGNISWIVLEQNGMDGYFQLLISTNIAASTSLNVSFSRGGLFTGGSATAPPTASDSINILSNATWWFGSGFSAVTSTSIHILQSTDGECTRVFLMGNVPSYQKPYLFAVWILDKISNPSTGWTNPYVCTIFGNTNSSTPILNLTAFASKYISVHNSTTMTCSPTYEALYDGATAIVNAQGENKINGKLSLSPMGVVCSTVGARGRHGDFYDFYWCNQDLNDGTIFNDEDSSSSYVKIGPLAIPWPNNTKLIKG